jgi:hypothetical protein
LPSDTRFFVFFRGVQSVRVSRSEPWPGEFSVPTGTSREEESRLVSDYQAKWREESQSWTEFELKLPGADALDATLVLSDKSAALKLGVMLNDRYYDTHIRAESIAFFAGDRRFTLEEFIALGGAYWEAFSEQRLP